ncbi:hypothetical protein [Streptomyces sp. NPDC056291]|uniref:hypothetical protein n=1 Tax=Streptomyces sp. NPDC056291 TaxID=3345772 RepID=UPI0035E28E36
MTIIRTARAAEGRFTQISNQILQDARISDRARGLGGRILSYPPDTRIDSVALSNGTKEGRDAVRRALSELEEFGYLTRVRKQNEDGRWVTESLFTDGPVALVPAPEKPTPENPSSVPPAAMDKTAGRTEDGFSGAKNQTRKEETRKDHPPTPHEERAEVADAPGGAGEVLHQEDKDAAAGAEYVAAVEVLCTQVEWNPGPKTRRQLEKNLQTLVPDPRQLKEITDRAAGWSVPEKKSQQQLLRRVTTIKKQIDTGVPELRSRRYLNTRAEVSSHSDQPIETELTWGWPGVDEEATS